jgi:hypothetical protein
LEHRTGKVTDGNCRQGGPGGVNADDIDLCADNQAGISFFLKNSE